MDLDGVPLVFGARIRLRHCGSGHWLMCDPDRVASGSNECSRVFLHERSKDVPAPIHAEGRMRIMPKSKTKHEHAPVTGNEMVQLSFLNDHNLNMTCKKETSSATGRVPRISTELNAMDVADAKPATKDRKALVTHDSSFRVVLFASASEAKQAPAHPPVCIGDVIRMFHAEQEGYLTAAGACATGP